MKEKKGKKSLLNLDNSLKRSTRLKQLIFVPLGATSIGIRTTSSSDLPRSYLRTDDSILICNTVGRYNNFIRRFEWVDTPYKRYDEKTLYILEGVTT